MYEAVLTLSASAITGYLTYLVVNEMICVGSLLTIGIGLKRLKLTDIKVSNFLRLCWEYFSKVWILFEKMTKKLPKNIRKCLDIVKSK